MFKRHITFDDDDDDDDDDDEERMMASAKAQCGERQAFRGTSVQNPELAHRRQAGGQLLTAVLCLSHRMVCAGHPESW